MQSNAGEITIGGRQQRYACNQFGGKRLTAFYIIEVSLPDLIHCWLVDNFPTNSNDHY